MARHGAIVGSQRCAARRGRRSVTRRSTVRPEQSPRSVIGSGADPAPVGRVTDGRSRSNAALGGSVAAASPDRPAASALARPRREPRASCTGGCQRFTRVADDVTGHASVLHVGARDRGIDRSLVTLVLGGRRQAAGPHVRSAAILDVGDRRRSLARHRRSTVRGCGQRLMRIARPRARCTSIPHAGDRRRPLARHRRSIVLEVRRSDDSMRARDDHGQRRGRVPDRRFRSVGPIRHRRHPAPIVVARLGCAAHDLRMSCLRLAPGAFQGVRCLAADRQRTVVELRMVTTAHGSHIR